MAVPLPVVTSSRNHLPGDYLDALLLVIFHLDAPPPLLTIRRRVRHGFLDDTEVHLSAMVSGNGHSTVSRSTRMPRALQLLSCLAVVLAVCTPCQARVDVIQAVENPHMQVSAAASGALPEDLNEADPAVVLEKCGSCTLPGEDA